jgi:hypothetical protein
MAPAMSLRLRVGFARVFGLAQDCPPGTKGQNLPRLIVRFKT